MLHYAYMKTATLVFLRKEGKICLAMKKRGFGDGKYNGAGGKVEVGETIEAAAVRELHEELTVVARTEDLLPVGHLDFFFEEHPDWNFNVHIFFLDKWEGQPAETEEMAPEWFSEETIPYESMWVDDPIWLPKALAGERIEGAFHFTDGGEAVLEYNLN
jgi:8-oxo-dGTP pyrophosphatase MutT (NUDIX family)